MESIAVLSRLGTGEALCRAQDSNKWIKFVKNVIGNMMSSSCQHFFARATLRKYHQLVTQLENSTQGGVVGTKDSVPGDRKRIQMARAARSAVRRRARMSDVAKLARVSAMTVSRALRSPEMVTPETLQRIEDAVKKIGYLPDRIAGSLSSRKSNVIGLIVPSLRNSLFAETIQGIADKLGQEYDLMISDSGYSLKNEEEAVVAFLSQRVCGMVLHNTKHTPRTVRLLKESGVPCVETGNLTRRPLDMTVSYSNFATGRAMTEYLIDCGYRQIGFVSLPLRDNDRAGQRRAGYVSALKARGLPLIPEIMLESASGLRSGCDAFAKLMQGKHPVDAVFLTGDVLAMGAILEANRRGWKIPEQVAIAGTDDNEIQENLVPSLTSIRFPRYEIGQKAAAMLLNRFEGRSTGTGVVDLGFEIIERDSTLRHAGKI
jgi:LacI family gluconate utilization system Gnt-I transcriptional repressor